MGAPEPDAASSTPETDIYTFERPVTFHHQDGSTSTGFIDLYKSGCFVLEAKQGSDGKPKENPLAGVGSKVGKAKKGTAVRGTKGWDDAMLRARAQAESYAKALPAEEGWPPFLVVTDVGHTIELFADFSGTGKNYTHFPDKTSFRISIDHLGQTEVRELLKAVWTDPLSLDPSQRTVKVTKEIADALAELAKSLEASGHAPASVALFLMRCLFTMFAEDINLIPSDSFKSLMERYQGRADKFHLMAKALWNDMDKGAPFSAALETDILRFNGGLFANSDAIPLNEDQLQLLIDAASADWCDVEPAIFGTLLERALDPNERHKLGAHFTPRAYVERLVIPAVIEPLRQEWDNVKAAIVQLANQGDEASALKEVRKFHQVLCALRILDPACGSGNFLYVTMEHMKRLEGEVLDLAEELGEDQYFLEMDQHTVDPHQFLGLEINPRAVPIAELVLWIGYLQWHFRTRGRANIAEPVLKNFDNIQSQDALIEYSSTQLVRDEHGKPISRWDGLTTKPHPTSGKEVPDETARVPVEKYIDPKPVSWPKADFIVGNPPFIGNKRMKKVLGEGYVEAVRAAHKDVPGVADFVMFWWNKAAETLALGNVRRFGFITTNSITQQQNRKVVEKWLSGKPEIHIAFAIPNHPWVEASDGADVRVAMTVARSGKRSGKLQTVSNEKKNKGSEASVEFHEAVARINPDLSVGADATSAVKLQANDKMSFQGPILVGEGFRISPDELAAYSLNKNALPGVVRPYLIARDISQLPEERYVVDFFGLSESDARTQYPELYQKILTEVKPFRDTVSRKNHRDNWWIFGEARPGMRKALKDLQRFIVTMETSTYKPFLFMDAGTVPDHKLYVIASDDAFHVGVLSSRAHLVWALSAGGNMGVGNDPTWTNTTCFIPFPFPDTSDAQKELIRELGEELDAHRKNVQSKHPNITITGMYNVLEKLKIGVELDDKEKDVHSRGLVSVLKELHDKLDVAVFDAYGWDKNLADDAVLDRLVSLNHERAKEEAEGNVRWLRRKFQFPDESKPAKSVQTGFGGLEQGDNKQGKKQPWPKTLPEQVEAVRDALASSEHALQIEEIAGCFVRANRKKVAEVVETLEALSQVHRVNDERYAV